MKICTLSLPLTFAATLSALEPPVRTGESARLHALFDSEWEHTMQTSPTWASQLGDRRFNDRWPDLSRDAIVREQEHAREVLKNLGTFDREKLAEPDRLDLDLFRWRLEGEVEGFRFGEEFIPLN